MAVNAAGSISSAFLGATAGNPQAKGPDGDRESLSPVLPLITCVERATF
jgi:hypothetical protein